MNNYAAYGQIPKPLYDAVLAQRENELERAFDYSATVLCQSPRQAQLEKRYPDSKRSNEFLENWYSFIGDSVHNNLERKLKKNSDYLVEKRIIRFDKPEGSDQSSFRRVGARFDCYDKTTKTLSDHKTTTTYIHGREMKPEWFTQLMVNAYFLMEEGYEVDWLAVNAIYVDWRDQRVKYNKAGEYPIVPCAEFKIPCPSKDECKKYYLTQLEKHVSAEEIADEVLPECPTEYCWERPAKFAVYKPGAGKAMRLLNTYEEAIQYIDYKKMRTAFERQEVLIEERPSTRLRCENYCSVNNVCNQYLIWKQRQDLLNKQKTEQ